MTLMAREMREGVVRLRWTPEALDEMLRHGGLLADLGYADWARSQPQIRAYFKGRPGSERRKVKARRVDWATRGRSEDLSRRKAG